MSQTAPNTAEDSDEVLIGQYVRGDAAAFDQLYRRHELRVWRYLERNVRSQATSDELLQEVWFTLARNAAGHESTARFRTGLFTLTHDKMTQALQAPPAETAPGGGPLEQALGQLPRDEREAYLLQVEGQVSVGEIAEITESTIDAAQNRLRQARLKLRELLGDKKPSEAPAAQSDLSEVDTFYRHLSATDPGRPGEWVRRKVQAYSAQQAAERAVRQNTKGQAPASVATLALAAATPKPKVAAAAPAPIEPRKPPSAAAGKSWMVPTIVGGVVLVGVLGYLIVPALLAPHDLSPAPTPPPIETAPPEAPAPRVAQAPPPSAPIETSPAPAPAAQVSEPETDTAAQPPAPTPPPAAAVVEKPAPAPEKPVARAPPAPKARVAARPATPAPQSPPVTSNRVVDNNTRPTPVAPVAAAPTPAPVSAPVATQQPAPPAPTPAPVVAAAAPAAAPAATPAAPVTNTPALTPPDELCKAVDSTDMNRVQGALGDHPNINARDGKGRTALILAIQHDRVDIVKALLAAGANPNLTDAQGRSPMIAAHFKGDFVIVKTLEKAGAH